MSTRPTTTFKEGIDKISKKGKTESPLSSVNTPNVYSLENAHVTDKVFIPLAPHQHHSNDKQGENNNTTISTARTTYSKSHPYNKNKSTISERSTMSKTDLKSTSTLKNIKPTISTTDVHALNKLNGITTPFWKDDSLRKTNIVPTQDPFVAQPNMTVTDLKPQKNKNEQNVSTTIQATNIETTTKPKMTESTKLGVTSTLLETVTFSDERSSI
ncbi:unnamed protein product [Mytilus edulis]|uniref:Uncharacterized protein n=1 Tax=Mytilus edulis TaxID=6550 RepID=A0A8S3PWT9_MYTED|nr:unnamed protein product [Mytilus edulis]